MYSGAIDCVKKIYGSEGFKGFYAGISAPIIGACFELATSFFTFGKVKEVLLSYNYERMKDDENYDYSLSMPQLFLAGGITGIFLSLVLTPIELIKCRMQVQARRLEMLHTLQKSQNKSQKEIIALQNDIGPIYKNTYECLKKSVKSEGFTGMYRGVSLTMMRDIPGNAVWFGFYEIGKRFFAYKNEISIDDISIVHMMISGGFAGFGYWMTCMPADTLKSIVQTDNTEIKKRKKLSIISLYKSVGYKNLYRGIYPTLFRAIPSNAVIFSSYELLCRLFNGVGESILEGE